LSVHLSIVDFGSRRRVELITLFALLFVFLKGYQFVSRLLCYKVGKLVKEKFRELKKSLSRAALVASLSKGKREEGRGSGWKRAKITPITNKRENFQRNR